MKITAYSATWNKNSGCAIYSIYRSKFIEPAVIVNDRNCLYMKYLLTRGSYILFEFSRVGNDMKIRISLISANGKIKIKRAINYKITGKPIKNEIIRSFVGMAAGGTPKFTRSFYQDQTELLLKKIIKNGKQ